MNLWWSYIHSESGKIHLKRWFPPQPGQMCDLQYAKYERAQGNDFILALTPYPVEADTREEAFAKVVAIFEELGYKQESVQYQDSVIDSCSSKLQRILAKKEKLKRYIDLDSKE